MSRELEGKVLIVTGAATGIGKAIAFAFGEAGARVVVNHLDTPDLAEAVVAEISHDGGEALASRPTSRARAELSPSSPPCRLQRANRRGRVTGSAPRLTIIHPAR
jgi:NAD(P)-dependent dehydrogenase (short-subunit alcohol dehydrogenase family)